MREKNAIKNVMIGGNHLASALIGMIGGNLPDFRHANYDEILGRFGQPAADMWVAWKAIMDLRDGIDADAQVIDGLIMKWRDCELRDPNDRYNVAVGTCAAELAAESQSLRLIGTLPPLHPDAIGAEVNGQYFSREQYEATSARPRTGQADVSLPAAQAETPQVSQSQLLHASLVQEMETYLQHLSTCASHDCKNCRADQDIDDKHEYVKGDCDCGLTEKLALLRRSAHAESTETETPQ